MAVEALRSAARSRSASVKPTRMGWIWVIVTSPVGSFTLTRLPGVTRIAPTRPSIGASILV